jgi:hypothetical protein
MPKLVLYPQEAADVIAYFLAFVTGADGIELLNPWHQSRAT